MTLYKLVDGERKELTPEEEQAYNDAQPTANELLDMAKIARCEYIEERRKQFQYSPILFEGNEYEATFIAQSKYFTFLLINTTGDINWRLTDGVTWVTLTQAQANNLKDAMITREVQAYQHESQKSLEIKAVTTNIEDVNLIDWEL